jgi:hypothetical protein
MDASRVSRGEAIAAAAGLVLLVSMFLPWYGGELTGAIAPVKVDTTTGWEVFAGVLDILIVALAATPIAIAIGRATDRLPPLPFDQGAMVLGAGALLCFIVVVRLVDSPIETPVPLPNVDVDSARKVGAFVALAAAAAIAYGGYLQRAVTRTA